MAEGVVVVVTFSGATFTTGLEVLRLLLGSLTLFEELRCEILLLAKLVVVAMFTALVAGAKWEKLNNYKKK